MSTGRKLSTAEKDKKRAAAASCGAPKPQRRSDDENGTTLINQSMYIFKSMQVLWYNMIHHAKTLTS